MWMRTFVCLACTLAATACDGSPDVSPPPEGEQLLAEPPEGWVQTFGTETPVTRMAEFVPPDTNPDDWDDKLTFEAFGGDPLPDPIEFVVGIAEDQAQTCDKHEHVNVQSGLENGYPTSVRLLVCTQAKLTDRGQVTLIKAIQGEERFYVITRARRTAPLAEGAEPMPAEDMARWSAYLRAIKVCDSRGDAHPCPGAPAQNDSSAKSVTADESA